MQDRGIECIYEPCSCIVIGPIASGEAYCSDFCRNAEARDLEAESCACGHPQCDVP
ncbi:MAG: metallothionein [Candidatus Eremiobacteraeota bacterium]|nr:metallothionein [Candidatus Eremiobacteraeota bacterium]